MTEIDMRRRRALTAAGGLAVAAVLPGCATPGTIQRGLNATQAPRVGDTWRYQYSSAWRNEAPRMFEVSVLAVGSGVRDRLTLAGGGAGDERDFLGLWELVTRSLGGGFAAVEFSPYLTAFDGPVVGEESVVRMPDPGWGTTWFATGRAVSAGSVQTPAGTFDSVQVDIVANRPFIRGQMDDVIDPVHHRVSAWFAMRARRVVRFSQQSFSARNTPLARDGYELVSFAAK